MAKPININKRNILLGGFILFMAAISIYFTIDTKLKLANGRYTIGTTLRFSLKAQSGRIVFYEYYVDGYRYESSSDYLYGAKVPNGRYYVKYAESDPSISVIYLNNPVSNKIDEAPPAGWEKRPW